MGYSLPYMTYSGESLLSPPTPPADPNPIKAHAVQFPRLLSNASIAGKSSPLVVNEVEPRDPDQPRPA